MDEDTKTTLRQAETMLLQQHKALQQAQDDDNQTATTLLARIETRGQHMIYLSDTLRGIINLLRSA